MSSRCTLPSTSGRSTSTAAAIVGARSTIEIAGETRPGWIPGPRLARMRRWPPFVATYFGDRVFSTAFRVYLAMARVVSPRRLG